MTLQTDLNKKTTKAIGCGLVILTILGFIWVTLFCGLDLFMNWVSEQAIMEVGSFVPDFRWITHTIASVLILLVCLLMSWLVKEPSIKRIFKLWMYAAILSIISIPVKTAEVSDQNLTAFLQAAALFLVIVGSYLLIKRKTEEPEPKLEKNSFPGLIVFIGAILCIPWLLWGALGSWFDTALEIIVGVLFSLYAVKFIFLEYLDMSQSIGREIKFSGILLDGLVIAIFLLINVAALAINGSQQMLVVTVPISGWLVAILSSLWMNNKGHGRLPVGIILGLIFTLPLLFFDMDELTAIFTGGAGETLEWATKAAWYTFMAIMMITFLLIPNFKNIRKLKLPRTVHNGLMVIGIVAIVFIYLRWGQVGFFGDNQFIILKQQADLTKVAETQDYSTRRTAVYNELVKTAEMTQADLRARLDAMHLEYTPYYLVNGIEVNGGLLAKLLLQNDPAVDRILNNPQLRPLPKSLDAGSGEIESLPAETLWNLSMIHADQVVKELGVTGEGILIGQTDSGVDGRHPEIAAAYRGAETGDDYNWYDPWNDTSFPTDLSGHGTQTLGIIVGKNTGVAPG
ncbi:hypothetical protein EG832_09860, partial [bacterium]|nr:hypothetical protein [bacterium]